MKSLKIAIIVIAVLAAIFFAGAQFLPNSYSVSRSVIIQAPDSVVFYNVVDFNNFLKWNPWSRMEPTAPVVITGHAGSPGHMYRWAGKELGKGHMQLQEVKHYADAEFQLTFEEPIPSVAQSHFSFNRGEGGTKVVWTMQGQSDAAVDRWMYLAMDRMMGKDFDSGLGNLKELSEAN